MDFGCIEVRVFAQFSFDHKDTEAQRAHQFKIKYWCPLCLGVKKKISDLLI